MQLVLFHQKAACGDCASVVVPQCARCCCSPGDPEGGAWARQERRDGCGRHHPEERLLRGGAQSEETLTDRTEKGGKKIRGEIISKRTDSVVTTPYSAWALADLQPPLPPHPSQPSCKQYLKNCASAEQWVSLSRLAMNKKTESNIMGGSQQHTPVFAASPLSITLLL